MVTIEHRVKRRIPDLFLLTFCGLETPDYRVRVGGIVQTVVHEPRSVMVERPRGIPDIEFRDTACVVCEDLYFRSDLRKELWA